MSRHIIGAAFIAALLAASVHAQEAQGRGGQTPAPAEKPPSGQNRTPPPAEAPAPAGQPVNVKLDLTITDQLASGAPAKKTVSMIVADRYSGSIRSIANTVRATLNVDATPQILQNGNIRLQLGLEYNPRQPTTAPEKVKGPKWRDPGAPTGGGWLVSQPARRDRARTQQAADAVAGGRPALGPEDHGRGSRFDPEVIG